MTTYRNDHEAALARVEALEHELAEARRQRRKPGGAPAPVSRKPWPLFAAGLIAGSIGIAAGVALAVAGSSEPAALGAPAPPHVDRSELASCANTIEAAPPIGAELSDPHEAVPLPVTALARTIAPCRAELHTLIEVAPVSAEEREALWRWALHEDELAGAISRIEVYYRSDPYQLDNYSTAEQLWREYSRAYEQRNDALSDWRLHFASS